MAKKNIVSNHPKQQTPPMSSSHTNIIGVAIGASPQLPDDDDDICPVCESECTCHNKGAAPSQSSSSRANAGAPSAPSLSTFSGSIANVPLKIKLTLPPTLKIRRHTSADQQVITTSAGHIVPTLNSLPPDPSGRLGASAITSHHLAPELPIQAVSRRRGRPPKAVTASREVAKTASASAQGASHAHEPSHFKTAAPPKYPGKKRPAVGVNRKKLKARITTGKQPKTAARKTVAPLLASDSELSELSDAERFPTFVPAASTSSHSSSSESSESDSDFGDIEAEETSFLIRDEHTKTHARRLLSGNESSQKKREQGSGNNWEIRPRKRSVGVEEDDADTESGESSDDEDDGMDEDNAEDEADEEPEADVEGEGLAEIEPDEEDTGGRLGVSFGGGASNWSEDEESSFDADLFFANLDDTSDSSSDSPARGEDGSDMEASGSFSAEEEDAVLLMDIDPSVHLRRSNGELEFGLEFDTLSFDWDGRLLLTSARLENRLDVGFSTDTVEGDVDMLNGDDRSFTRASSDSERMSLEESDGDTTEDELVDSNGLPNSRAMMLFRWPTTVSTVHPLLTVGQVSTPPSRVPPDASESMRIALASMSAQCQSPAPTPADILAGRISMDDLDDIEMDKRTSVSPARGKRSAGPPHMGEFVASEVDAHASAIIDGKGVDIPSPFPRSKRPRKRRATSGAQSSSTTDPLPNTNTDTLGSSLQSSDEMFSRSRLQTTSDFSSTEAIDLDDVLDSSFLDSDPLFFDYESQTQATQTSTSGPHMRSLTRWDRIPMATFRRTRETAVPSAVGESAGSDTGRDAFSGMGAMNGSAMLMHPKSAEKKSPSSARKRSKGKNTSSVIISPALPPLLDGDRTPTSSSPNHGNRPKKEVRREKAMMKRKMMGKPVQQRHQQARAHNHLPNFKTRASSSMQRGGHFSGGSSSVPPFNL